MDDSEGAAGERKETRMKIKALASLCSRAKQIVLHERGTGLWIGDGRGLYRMPDALRMCDEGMVTAIFDVPPEKAADYHIIHRKMPEAISTEDAEDGEEELSFDLQRRVIFDGTDYLPLTSGDGRCYLIRTKYVKPLEDAEQLGFALRHRLAQIGEPYIAVKDGMFMVGVVAAVETGDEKTEGWAAEGWINAVSLAMGAARRFEAPPAGD